MAGKNAGPQGLTSRPCRWRPEALGVMARALLFAALRVPGVLYRCLGLAGYSFRSMARGSELSALEVTLGWSFLRPISTRRPACLSLGRRSCLRSGWISSSSQTDRRRFSSHLLWALQDRRKAARCRRARVLDCFQALFPGLSAFAPESGPTQAKRTYLWLQASQVAWLVGWRTARMRPLPCRTHCAPPRVDSAF